MQVQLACNKTGSCNLGSGDNTSHHLARTRRRSRKGNFLHKWEVFHSNAKVCILEEDSGWWYLKRSPQDKFHGNDNSMLDCMDVLLWNLLKKEHEIDISTRRDDSRSSQYKVNNLLLLLLDPMTYNNKRVRQ